MRVSAAVRKGDELCEGIRTFGAAKESGMTALMANVCDW